MTTLTTFSELPPAYALSGAEIFAVTQASESVQVNLNTIKNFALAGSAYIPLSEIGLANGVASLDGNARLPLIQLPTGVVQLSTINQFTKSQSTLPVTLTSGVNITIDASQSTNFKVILTSNANFVNPTNLTDGMIIYFKIKQDSAGSRTLSYGTVFNFPGGITPILSTTPNAIDLLRCYYDATDGVLLCTISQAYAP